MTNKKSLDKEKILSTKNLFIFITIFLFIIYELIFITINNTNKFDIIYGLLIPIVILVGVILIILKLSYTFKKIEKPEFSNFYGIGTLNEPFVINLDLNFPKSYRIKNSQNYYIFQGVDMKSLIIVGSSNITIKSCNFHILNLKSCSKINIINSSIEKKLCLKDCQHIELANCYINQFSFFLSYDNLIKDCRINTIENENTYGNIFNKNIIKKNELSKLITEKSRDKIRNLLHINLAEIFMIIVCLISALLLSSYLFKDPIIIALSTILISFLLLLLISLLYLPEIITRLRLSKKLKDIIKYPNNKIIE